MPHHPEYPSFPCVVRSIYAGLAVAVGVMVPLGAAHANANPDWLIEGARQCTQYFPIEEKKNNIPSHLLAAIATTESGRYHKGLGMSVPWPWTINVEGKGYYFNSKIEAIAQTQRLLAQGYQSIDVGCMQVNLKHHPRAFANLNQAFDPASNVAYSAKFLSSNYATLGDWIKATAAYHSRTPVHGQRYLGDIERSWNKIVAKVAAARASKTGSGQVASPGPARASDGVAVSTPAPRSVSVTKPRVVETTRAPREARRVRVIEVNDAPARRAGEVLLVRASQSANAPTTALPSEASASVAPTSVIIPEVNTPAGSSIRRVTLDNPSANPLPSEPAKGPQFIFAN